MSLTLEEIEAEALQLPADSRAELAERLLESLTSVPDPRVEREWLEEAQRRRQDLLSGKVEGIPADEVFKRVGAKLA